MSGISDKISNKVVEITADGSATIYLPELNEHYHSIKGALTESLHIFIDCGLRHCPKQTVKILEIGFGTGLNAALTAMNAGTKTIEYHTFELYPLSINEIRATGYFSLPSGSLLRQIHETRWEELTRISPAFSIKKIKRDFTEESTELPTDVDIVYFDAFAPEKQPEMWTDPIFQKIHKAMSSGGILTTYCAKGEVRRRLQAAGFSVERLPGPPHGKREILRAVKTI